MLADLRLHDGLELAVHAAQHPHGRLLLVVLVLLLLVVVVAVLAAAGLDVLSDLGLERRLEEAVLAHEPLTWSLVRTRTCCSVFNVINFITGCFRYVFGGSIDCICNTCWDLTVSGKLLARFNRSLKIKAF